MISDTTAAPPRPPLTQAGFHENVPYADYARIGGIRWSTLKPYKRSALAGYFAETTPDEDTDALEFGTAFHTAVLEPEKFAELYVTMPEFPGDYRSKEHKDAKKRWQDENVGKGHLKADRYQELLGMQASLRQHKTAGPLLYDTKGKNELTQVWRDSVSKQLCQGRLDRFCRAPSVLLYPTVTDPKATQIVSIDLKTTASTFIEPRDFWREYGKHGYFGQSAFYDDGLQTLRPEISVVHVCIAVEKKPPFDVVVHIVGDDTLAHGRNLYRRLLERRAAALESNKFPGISSLPVTIQLPDWYSEGDL
ncbi:MAG TPA: PD-(D/E)XK nuclease-like domain-containing protein [Tepidisphaeraceae bacterium]|jgi:hypothetical protein